MLLGNLAWSYAGTALEAVVGLAVVAGLTRGLQIAEYGELILALAIAELLLLIDVGLLSVLTRGLIAERTRGGGTAFSRLFGAALLASGALGALGALLLIACSVALEGSALVPGLHRHFPFVGMTAGGIVVFALPAHVVSRTHEALQNYATLAVCNVALSVLRAVAVVFAFQFGGGLIAFGAVYVGLAAARLLLLATGLARVGDPVTSQWRRPDWQRLGQVWRPGGLALLDNTARYVVFGIDALVLSAFGAMDGVALFGVGRRIPAHLHGLLEKGIAVVFPVLAELQSTGDVIGLRDRFVRTCRLSFSIMLPAVILSVAVAEPVIRVWVDHGYSNAIAPMRWLLASNLALSLSVPSITLLYATERIGLSARIAVYEALANLGLSLALVIPYGAAGVAAATAITHLAFTLGWLMPVACGAVGIRVAELTETLCRDTAASTAALLPGLILGVRGVDIVPPFPYFAGIGMSVGAALILWLRSDVPGLRHAQLQAHLAWTSLTLGRRFDRRYFETRYRETDPWGFTRNEYEKEKYRQTLELIPRGRYGRILEVGCAEGVFTRELASRGDCVCGIDISERALKRARIAVHGHRNVEFRRMDIFEDGLDRRFDLVVCSEVLYFAENERALDVICRKISGWIDTGGYALLVHMRIAEESTTGWVAPDLKFGADSIHERFAKVSGLTPVSQRWEPAYGSALFRRERA
jgi:O-antigen/teichoic acid export membrane protein/SAM-dependent methyltransferase